MTTEDNSDSSAGAAQETVAATIAETENNNKMEESTADNNNKKEEPRTMQDVKRAFQKLGTSSSQVLKTSIETFRRAEGKTLKADEYVDTLEDALKQLEFMVDMAKQQQQQSKKNNQKKWDFRSVPAALFEKTLEDVFVAFLKWATVEQQDDETKKKDTAAAVEETKVGKINVSKAFRRLESYASWMDANAANLENLTTESVQDAWAAWKLKISYDKADRLVWWVDVAAMDLDAVKARDAVDSLRVFVWFAHLVLFDEKAQANGMVLAENMGKIKFWNGMTMIPPKLSLKLDRLTIGVLPIKMKKLYMLECPVWCDVLVKMMKPFVSKKIKSRIVVLKESSLLEEELGKDCIPQGFATCDGQLVGDIVADKHFANLPDKKEDNDPETAQI